jgi:tetratricopeptide (TPR) repeat protein
MGLRRVGIPSAAIALLFCLNLLSARAADGPSPMELGQKALADKAGDAAITEFSKLIESEPSNAEAYRQRAFAHMGAEKLDLALADLNKAIELAPAEAVSYRNRAMVLWNQGDHSRAMTDFNEAVRLDPSDAQTYVARGFAYHSSGDHDAAIDDYSNVLQIDPTCTKAYAYRGLAFLSKKDYDATIRDCDEALRIDPDCLDAHMGRGLALLGKGEPEAARQHFSEALRIDPNCAGAYLRRGQARDMQKAYDVAIADYSETLRLDPNRVEAYLRRSFAYYQKEQYDSAMGDLDTVIRLQPESPCCYELRAVMALERQDYERGTADLEAAIRLNPADRAASFEAWPKQPLNDADLEHGREQVRQMLQDRPAMARYGEKAEVLCQWAARKFAGEDLGQRIFWDATEPTRTDARCGPPKGAERAWIQVCRKHVDGPEKDQEQSFEDLWLSVAFELYNVSHSKDFLRIGEDIAAGRLSKRQSVSTIVACESQAAEKARSFYIHKFLPWAKDHGVSTRPRKWFLARRSDPSDDILLDSVDENSSYWRHYEYCFDCHTLEALSEKGEYQKAADLAAELLPQAETDEDRFQISRMRGYCLLKLERASSAIEAFDESIRLNPQDALSRVYRAHAYLRAYDFDRAVGDCTEALRLSPCCVEAYRVRSDAYQRKGDSKSSQADAARVEMFSEVLGMSADSDDAFSLRQGIGQQEQWQSPASLDRSYYETLANDTDGATAKPDNSGIATAATEHPRADKYETIRERVPQTPPTSARPVSRADLHRQPAVFSEGNRQLRAVRFRACQAHLQGHRLFACGCGDCKLADRCVLKIGCRGRYR